MPTNSPALLRPFQRDQKNDFANDAGDAIRISRLGQVLGTRCDSAMGPGELPWNTKFGSRLHLLRHRNITDGTPALALEYAREAVEAWEPGERITRVERVPTPRRTELRIRALFLKYPNQPASAAAEVLAVEVTVL